MLKIVICDDHALVRGGLCAMLEQAGELAVVGEAGDGAEAVELVLATHPDVVLMDVEMPKLDGIEAIRRLRAAGSRAQVLVVTTFDDDDYVLGALRAGAAGFVLKATTPAALAHAVRAVAAGEQLLDPALTRRLVERLLGHPSADLGARERLGGLTEREQAVLRELAQGSSNVEIGRALHLSEPTVKTHVTKLLAKLGVASRVQAVVFAYETGFVRPGETAIPGQADE